MKAGICTPWNRSLNIYHVGMGHFNPRITRILAGL